MSRAMWWGVAEETKAPGKQVDLANADAPAVTAAKLPRMAVPTSTVELVDSIVSSTSLGEGIQSLYERGEFCDMTLVACEQRFRVHKAMLAAMSANFREYLQQDVPARQSSSSAPIEDDPMDGILAPLHPCKTESCADDASTPMTMESSELTLEVREISTSEALQTLLSYIYSAGTTTASSWEYRPSSCAVNKDVLRLARHFGFAHLHEHAARTLTKGLSTSNVVERLVTCEDFGMNTLREKIIQKLTACPAELMLVSGGTDIMQHPGVLQDLLVQMATSMVERRDAANAAAAATVAAQLQRRAEKSPPRKAAQEAKGPNAKRLRRAASGAQP